MSKLWRRLGMVGFWLIWPVLFLYFKRGARTRILLVCGREILVVSGWLGNGKWGLPGGGLHKNEPLLDGVLRELREETSIMLEPAQVKPLLSNTYRDIGFRFPCHYFVTELAQKPTAIPQKFEISRLAWVDHHQLTKANANPDVLEACAAWWER